MNQPLIPSRLLFRFSVPCLYLQLPWTDKGLELPEEFRLPALGELEGKKTFADVRMAWSEDGMALWLRVVGKQQAPWCADSRQEDSDGIQIWIDTRDTHNVHRASRFCHRFVFLPSGGGPRRDQPVADQMLINRAREHAKPIRPNQLKVAAGKRTDGYWLSAYVPSGAMTGFDPVDQPKLGFTYAVIDRELGIQSFSAGPELPFWDDPSVWGTLELIRREADPDRTIRSRRKS
jgi:hypothetical protein